MKIVKFFRDLVKSTNTEQQEKAPNIINTKLDNEVKLENSKVLKNETSNYNNVIQDKEYLTNYEAYEKWLCPYCQHHFEKEVTRKRKCPECQNTFLVRTHFASKRKMILKEEQLDNYEKQRETFYKNKWIEDFFKRYGTTLEEEKRKSASGSSYPYDIAWGMLNRVAMENVTNMQWGLFRNVRMDMGDLLKQEEKPQKSLRFYLEVCYLDINGVTNTTTNPQLLKEFPPFRPKDFGFLAPGILSYIELLSEDLNIGLEELKILFIEHNNRSYNDNQLVPIKPEKAWITLENELLERKKENNQ